VERLAYWRGVRHWQRRVSVGWVPHRRWVCCALSFSQYCALAALSCGTEPGLDVHQVALPGSGGVIYLAAGDEVAVATCEDNQVHVLRGAEVTQTLSEPGPALPAASGSLLLYATQSEVILSDHRGQVSWRAAIDGAASSLCLSPDGAVAAVGEAGWRWRNEDGRGMTFGDSQAHLISTSDGSRLRSYPTRGNVGVVLTRNLVAISEYSGSDERRLRVYNIEREIPIVDTRGGAVALDQGADERIGVTRAGRLEVMDAKGGTLREVALPGLAQRLHLCGDLSLAYTRAGVSSGFVHVGNVRTGAELLRLEDVQAMRSALYRRPSGEYLVAVCRAEDEGTAVTVYTAGEEAADLRRRGRVMLDGRVTAATFTPAGDRLILGTAAGRVYVCGF